jgi:hypothetical protein
MIIITNLCIGITYLFSIILIIDELYNIGFFTFNYTYQYNYGSFISKFNNVQTIECETNRFNVYNNINFIFKDIFNKSYFNYLLIIVATLITILCCIAYAVYFYFKFIIEQPQECSFDEATDLSLPKQLLKCLCDECHKLIPNCTTNYFIVFILLIIVPLSYIFKTMFNINFTPNSDNALFGFIYICVFLLLIFYYSFNLFNRKTEYKYKDLVVYSLFTLIFISSGYIYKYILNKYNNINLNSSNDISTIYDIYKQTPPIKPKPIEKPLYKGTDLITIFKYNEGDKDPDYKIKKSIVDDYHKSIKNYDNDMKNYNVRYNAYTNSLTSSKLGDKTNYFDIAINILGLKNYMHIYLIILMIISLVIYNIYNDDISYVCFIYVLTMLITLTIMNSILYYNTYINKYIIYEPMAHYKNDITNANTALNLELNPASGVVFYNKLINNDKSLMTEPNSDIKDGKEILEDIKKLKDIKYYTLENTSNINKDITNNFIDTGLNFSLYSNYNKINDATIYYRKTFEYVWTASNFEDDPIKYLIYNCVKKITSTNNMKIESVKKFTFKYKDIDIRLSIKMNGYYKYYYYIAYQYKYILENIIDPFRNANLTKILELTDILTNIMNLLDNYKGDNEYNNKLIIKFKLTSLMSSLNGYPSKMDERFTSIKDNINEINNNLYKCIETRILKNSALNTDTLINIINLISDDITADAAAAAAATNAAAAITIANNKKLSDTTSITSITDGMIQPIIAEYKIIADDAVTAANSEYDAAVAASASAIAEKTKLDIVQSVLTTLINDANKQKAIKTAISTANPIDNAIGEIFTNEIIKTANENFTGTDLSASIAAFKKAIADADYVTNIIKNKFSLNYNYNKYGILYNNKSNKTISKDYNSKIYYELPNNIIDDNNNEYYLNVTKDTFKVYIYYKNIDISDDTKVNLYCIKSKYLTSTNLQISNAGYNIESNNIIKMKDDLHITDGYSIPFIFYKNNSSSIASFKNIVFAVLLNSIVNIQYKFTNKVFLPKITNQKTTVIENKPNSYDPPDEYFTDITKEIKINYINNSNIIDNSFITLNYKKDDISLSKTPITTSNTNIFVLIILALNVYNISRKDIKNIINANILYIIKYYNNLTNKDIKDIIDKLNTTEIDENEDEDENIKELYNKNTSIINLIIILFENLVTLILKELKTGITSLCIESTASLSLIETELNNYVPTNSKSTSNNGYNDLVANKATSSANNEISFINKINNLLRSYFNIVIFLLDNLKLNTNTAEIDAITTNFNFYNKEDIVKNAIQKRLTIGCDYYSKYNKLDSKQLSYFKINANNVNYNFPILMIIFLIILGEPIFIKS